MRRRQNFCPSVRSLYCLSALSGLSCPSLAWTFSQYTASMSPFRRLTQNRGRNAGYFAQNNQGSTGNFFEYPAQQTSGEEVRKKRIVFIRHGRTYMNDYINGIHYGGPGFTDVFPDTPEYKEKYYDSPLGPRGLEQVEALNQQLKQLAKGSLEAAKDLSLSDSEASILDELDLIVTSPLTRALQTTQQGLWPAIQSRELPTIALPQASERIFLYSDLGKTRSELKQAYPSVDFETGFEASLAYDDFWHFIPTPEQMDNYVEWRPNGNGQVYACQGEPESVFAQRMDDLCQWLDERPESTIAVVCHAGVILWYLGEIVENCAIRIVEMDQLKSPSRLTEAPKEQAKNFK